MRERFLLLRPVIYDCNNGQIGVLNNIIKMSFQFEIIILIIWAIVSAETNYRHMFIDSSELCENTFAPKPIRTGGGAIILQLSKPKVQFQPSQKISKSCEIRFKVTRIFYLFIIIFAFTISVGILSSIWVKCFYGMKTDILFRMIIQCLTSMKGTYYCILHLFEIIFKLVDTLQKCSCLAKLPNDHLLHF